MAYSSIIIYMIDSNMLVLHVHPGAVSPQLKSVHVSSSSLAVPCLLNIIVSSAPSWCISTLNAEQHPPTYASIVLSLSVVKSLQKGILPYSSVTGTFCPSGSSKYPQL